MCGKIVFFIDKTFLLQTTWWLHYNVTSLINRGLIKKVNLLYSWTTRTGALERRLSSHNDFWKEKILKYFCKRTNKIQDSTICSHWKLSCRLNLLTSRETALKFTNVIGPFAKTLNNLLVSGVVLIGQSSSKSLRSRSRTVIEYAVL